MIVYVLKFEYVKARGLRDMLGAPNVAMMMSVGYNRACVLAHALSNDFEKNYYVAFLST